MRGSNVQAVQQDLVAEAVCLRVQQSYVQRAPYQNVATYQITVRT